MKRLRLARRRVTGSQPSSPNNHKEEDTMQTRNAIEKKTEALREATMRALPKRITCPRCGKTKARTAFGVRVMARDDKGMPTRVAKQSYCASCRGR